MGTSPRFSDPDLDTLRRAKILGVRSGTEHKYTGVWVVVVGRSVCVRSWSDKPTGWYRAVRKAPRGAITAYKSPSSRHRTRCGESPMGTSPLLS